MKRDNFGLGTVTGILTYRSPAHNVTLLRDCILEFIISPRPRGYLSARAHVRSSHTLCYGNGEPRPKRNNALLRAAPGSDDIRALTIFAAYPPLLGTYAPRPWQDRSTGRPPLPTLTKTLINNNDKWYFTTIAVLVTISVLHAYNFLWERWVYN